MIYFGLVDVEQTRLMVGEQPWNKLVGHLKVKFFF